MCVSDALRGAFFKMLKAHKSFYLYWCLEASRKISAVWHMWFSRYCESFTTPNFGTKFGQRLFTVPNFNKVEVLSIFGTKLSLKVPEIIIIKFHLYYHIQRYLIIHFVFFYLKWKKKLGGTKFSLAGVKKSEYSNSNSATEISVI